MQGSICIMLHFSVAPFISKKEDHEKMYKSILIYNLILVLQDHLFSSFLVCIVGKRCFAGYKPALKVISVADWKSSYQIAFFWHQYVNIPALTYLFREAYKNMVKQGYLHMSIPCGIMVWLSPNTPMTCFWYSTHMLLSQSHHISCHFKEQVISSP